MENCPTAVDESPNGSASAENFQKFIYELFEKNGVMNDLRSYLRGHIVSVLRSAQTGDPPPCQKHFNQRLDLTFQALNILIAEYLLRLEFSYSLSVFISEIPLANMVFAFAKTLMNKVDDDDSRPRFKDTDVWCILNYLGVKIDSEHASSIVDMYHLECNSPLLLCILKSAPLFKEPIVIEQVNSSDESLSSIKSSETAEEKPKSPQRKPSFQDKCKHYVSCKTCQSRMAKIKDKYRGKKKEITKNLKDSSVNSLNVDSLMKNIGSMERSLIDEMFEQLKSVYETEMDMMKEEEDKRVKRSLATHSTQLQKRREQMEESFKAREAKLENNVRQKKRFLWGLARALREQHEHMTRAMHAVHAETTRLNDKEESLKSQLAEAETILRQRGEEMRRQISNELSILEGHLESMKKERDSINRERSQLEQFKDHPKDAENLQHHYDLLKNELALLKKYLETAKLEPKCVIERSTLTDLQDVTSRIDVVLNNGQDVRTDDRVKPKQLVNDFKKQKNVNFSQSNLDEIYRERSRSRSRSSASSEAGDAQFDTSHDAIQRLTGENEQLRDFARQQREHIESLSSQQARLQAELTAARFAPSRFAPSGLAPSRPRTAPAFGALHLHTPTSQPQRLGASASVNNFNFGWRKGAGEELSFFSSTHPRVVLPADSVPFVGVLTRQTDHRTYLINQWRSLRRRMSPLGGVSKPRASSPIQRTLVERPESAGPSIRIQLEQVNVAPIRPETGNTYQPEVNQHRPRTTQTEMKTREKSPKSVLREAKEKLKNKDNIKDNVPTTREKSPSSVLREAKLRLRKLEIEAEAVEQSYLDFRRKQSKNCSGTEDLDSKPSTSIYKLDQTYTKEHTSTYEKPKSNEYDKFIREYQTKYNIGTTHFNNKNTASIKISPIPKAYSTQEAKKSENYLETPLSEFRKYYSERRYSNEIIESRPRTPKSRPVSDSENTKGTRKEIIRQVKNDKLKELELLKHNIGMIYNMPEQAIVETPNESNNEIVENKHSVIEENNNESVENEHSIQNEVVEVASISNMEERNLLRIEVESVSEVNDVKITESQTQDLLLVVESSVDNKDESISECDLGKEKISTQMTIIVSPKRSSPWKGELSESMTTRDGSLLESAKSSRKEASNLARKGSVKSERLSKEIADSFYDFDNDRVSSIQMQLDLSKDALDNTISELEQNEDPDYPDDFSADVDNYNSRTELNQSPISLPKTSDDENFWES